MTREDIENCFSYHAAGAALEHYQQEYLQPRISDSMHIVDSFEAGAEWAKEFMIKRACGWLYLNIIDYVDGYDASVEFQELLTDFRKELEK